MDKIAIKLSELKATKGTVYLNRPQIRVQSITPTPRHTKTLQFQHTRGQRYRNVPVPQCFLRPNGPTSNIPENDGYNTKWNKINKHIPR